MPHVAADDERDPIRIDLRRRTLFCHVSALLLVLAVDETAIETINYYVMNVFQQDYFGDFQESLLMHHVLGGLDLPARQRVSTNSRSLTTAAWSR
jgi:hypothetical protein